MTNTSELPSFYEDLREYISNFPEDFVAQFIINDFKGDTIEACEQLWAIREGLA